jgi:hypothetical protein
MWKKSEDVSNSWGIEFSKGVHYCSFVYYGEQCYEHISNSHASEIRFSFSCMNSSELAYCMLSFNNCRRLFGCIGMKQKQYCILNKQYSKEDYDALVPKLIEHMKARLPDGQEGEWGKFLPVDMAQVPYNESVAQEYFPLSKEQAIAQGFRWRDQNAKQYEQQKVQLADDIADANSGILLETLACEACGRNYKIVQRELAFHKDMNLSLPRKCHLCRHADRVKQRNPRRLWNRNCDKCGKVIESSYEPGRTEKVYCEEHYLKEVY